MSEQSQLKIIEQFYEVAASPELFDEFMDLMHERLDLIRSDSEITDSEVVKSHLDRATALVDVITPWRNDTDDELHQQFAIRVQAMLATDAAGNIVEANSAAKAAYELLPDAKISDLPLSAVEQSTLLNQIRLTAEIGRSANNSGDVIRLTNTTSERPMLVTLEFFESKVTSRPLVIVKTSDVGWPPHMGSILRNLFKLSRAEVEVVQLMVEGDKVEEIATRRCSTVATVRSQLRSIFAKTDTHSQLDCVRMVFGLALMHDLEEGSEVAARIQSESGEPFYPTEDQRRVLKLSDGRQIDYAAFGALKGPTVLFYHCQVFGDIWFKEAVDAAKAAGLRVIAPLRPGFGRTTIYDGEYSDPENFTSDVKQLLDHENVHDIAVFSVGCGLVHALALANCEPRIKSVTATHPILPALTDADLEGMCGYTYLMQHTRLHFPVALKFMCRAVFAFASKSGLENYGKALLKSAPKDMEWFSRSDIFPVVSQGRMVHREQGYVGTYGDLRYPSDWTDLLINCPAPIRLVIGEHDRNVQWAAAKRWDAELEHVDLHVLPDSGYLVHHQRYDTIIKWLALDLETIG